MKLCNVSNVEEMCNYMDSIFDVALFDKADKIVFFYSIYKANRFVVSYLKQDKYGNETVISLYDNILEINNNDILIETINKFKEKRNNRCYNISYVPIEILTDLSMKCNDKFYNEILEALTEEILGDYKIKEKSEKFDNVYNTIKEIKDKLTIDEKMKIIKLLI